MEIKDIKVGDSFIYNGRNYTKLNENNLCIIDDYNDGFMRCIFDQMDNKFSESLIRLYINSVKFINKLNVDLHDTLFVDGDYLTLLSKEEYKEYKPLIKNYECSWWLRSGTPSNPSRAYYVYYNGRVNYDSIVTNSFGVRPALILKPGVVVELRRWGK